MRTRFPAIPRHARPAMLLAAGLLAVAMHALSAMGLMPAHRDGGGFSPEICRGDGVVRTGAGGTADIVPGSDGAGHDCCKLCAVCSPILFADVTPDLGPAPPGDAVRPVRTSAWPATKASVAHPPRGPPPSA